MVARLTPAERSSIQTRIDSFHDAANDLAALLQTLLDEWQTDFDNRSESWQEGDNGSSAQERIDLLQSYLDEVPAPLEWSLDDLK